MIREVVYPEARIVFDASKPDGTPRKLLDVSKLHARGWRHSIDLRQGIEETYRWFLDHTEHARQPARGTAAR
jgi:GDP-L-fucose synthase